MLVAAKIIVIIFGLFLICVGILMLFSPQKANSILRKAGSTNFINYFEITIRMIPAAALIIYSDHSKFSEIFSIVGWFMIATSLFLYFVPRKLHNGYALMCADILKPFIIRLISPLSVLLGCAVIYSVI